MKTIKYLLMALLLAGIMPQEAEAKRMKAPKMYMFGFSASFQDSIVYMTDVQEVEGAWYDTKTEFLLGRQHYSYQLKDYLANDRQQPNRVCMVMFALTRKEAEKKFIKLRKEYTVKARGKYDVRYLTTSEFKFQAVDMSDDQ